jgi:hypothetical protein
MRLGRRIAKRYCFGYEVAEVFHERGGGPVRKQEGTERSEVPVTQRSASALSAARVCEGMWGSPATPI